jgi:hypothetical protein
MRMMGVDSVEYHRATVLARGDDHPGQALGYYASRGETPLLWGGQGAELLGLEGAVTDEQYEALYGPGGAADPTTGRRLVRTTRPGLELVISAQLSRGRDNATYAECVIMPSRRAVPVVAPGQVALAAA